MPTPAPQFDAVQLEILLPIAPGVGEQIRSWIIEWLSRPIQPSARELLSEVERRFGVKSRWDLREAVHALAGEGAVPREVRTYLDSLIASGELEAALRGESAPDPETTSSIDSLLQQSREYRSSANFQEMIQFIGRFRDYAPYNNMLVHLQNPACTFFATEKHWRTRFGAKLIEDARPMVILAPMTPVILVYDISQVQDAPLPEELERFAVFEGRWQESWLKRTVENAELRDLVQVAFKPLSSTLAGYATMALADGHWKRRIAIHGDLNGPSRFGVLCHELAHIYLGHLGADKDHWWPSRRNLTRHAVEVEAETVAYLVTQRLGLQGGSSAYVSRHLPDGRVPEGVSMDMICKVAGRIEQMTARALPRRERREPRGRRG